MTKEELEKEAEGYTNKLLEDWELYDPEALQEAYIAGAEPREKRITELEQQVEQMKCCGNCKNEGDYKEPYRYSTGWCNICKRHKVAKGNFDKWEIKEK